MLFYERSETLEPVDQFPAPTSAPSQCPAETDVPSQESASVQSKDQLATPDQSHPLPQEGSTGHTQEGGSVQSPDVSMVQAPADLETAIERTQSAPAEAQDDDPPTVPVSAMVLQTSPSPAATPRKGGPAQLSSLSPLKVPPIHVWESVRSMFPCHNFRGTSMVTHDLIMLHRSSKLANVCGETARQSGEPLSLQGVSTLDLGQGTVMGGGDQEVVQPMRSADLNPCSTVTLPHNMPRPIYEVTFWACTPVLSVSVKIWALSVVAQNWRDERHICPICRESWRTICTC